MIHIKTLYQKPRINLGAHLTHSFDKNKTALSESDAKSL